MNDVIDRATRVLRDVFGYSAFRGELAHDRVAIAGVVDDGYFVENEGDDLVGF